jgi:hypothetical protein
VITSRDSTSRDSEKRGCCKGNYLHFGSPVLGRTTAMHRERYELRPAASIIRGDCLSHTGAEVPADMRARTIRTVAGQISTIMDLRHGVHRLWDVSANREGSGDGGFEASMICACPFARSGGLKMRTAAASGANPASGNPESCSAGSSRQFPGLHAAFEELLTAFSSLVVEGPLPQPHSRNGCTIEPLCTEPYRAYRVGKFPKGNTPCGSAIFRPGKIPPCVLWPLW